MFEFYHRFLSVKFQSLVIFLNLMSSEQSTLSTADTPSSLSTACSGGKGQNESRKMGKPKIAETLPEMVRAWPYCTFLIILNEFMARFANISIVMGLYFLNVLKLNSNQTTIMTNVKRIIGGFFALLGSGIADGYIGKFKSVRLRGRFDLLIDQTIGLRAILYGTIIYGFGKILLSGASFEPSGSFIHPWLDYIGITIILFGNGFIVPCVASFGGDQFEPHQEKMVSVYFSIFYASINAGALIATILLPILRSMPCLGQDSCYPLSFAVSAVCMLISTAVFFAGSRWYKKTPPKGNVFADVFKTIKVALRNKRRSKKRRNHWLDHYLDTHDCNESEKCQLLKRRKRDEALCERESFLRDIRSLIRILVMFAPLPMFWALYDQQYSVWLIQAIQMDIRLWGDHLLLPDMMQFVNPLLTLTFIFLFETVVYPIASYFVKLTPLRKMVSGGVLASMAFFVSFFVQLKINATLPELPVQGHSFVSFMNNLDDCALNITYLGDGNGERRFLYANQTLVNNRLLEKQELFSVPTGPTPWSIHYDGADCGAPNLPRTLNISAFADKSINFVGIGPNGAFTGQADPYKPTGGTGEFSVSIILDLADFTNFTGNLAFCRLPRNGMAIGKYHCDPHRGENFYALEMNGESHDKLKLSGRRKYIFGNSEKVSVYPYRPVRSGNWGIFYLHNGPKDSEGNLMEKEKLNAEYSGESIEMHDQGGVYAVVLSGTKAKPRKRVFLAIPPNSMGILWQVPQIAIITAAEILFSIPGYEFSYSQSAASMKSVMQAFWFLTVAGGDLIIIFVTYFEFGDMAVQFFAYAIAMLVVIFIFALLSIFYYEYRVPSENDDEDNDGDEGKMEEMGKKNGFEPNFHAPMDEMGTARSRSNKTTS